MNYESSLNPYYQRLARTLCNVLRSDIEREINEHVPLFLRNHARRAVDLMLGRASLLFEFASLEGERCARYGPLPEPPDDNIVAAWLRQAGQPGKP